MKITEITKDEFKRKLQDPTGEAVRKEIASITPPINKMGWDITLEQVSKGELYLLLSRQEFSKYPSNGSTKHIKRSLAKLHDEYDIVVVRGKLHQQKGIDLDWHIMYNTK